MSEDAVGYVGLAAVVGVLGLHTIILCRRSRPAVPGRLEKDPRGPLPLNTVRMQSTDFLRVTTHYDIGLHLSMRTEPETGRMAMPARQRHRRRVEQELACYDAEELCLTRWTSRTMCGLAWWQMASHNFEIALVASQPDYMCRACTDAVARGEGMLRAPRTSP